MGTIHPSRAAPPWPPGAQNLPPAGHEFPAGPRVPTWPDVAAETRVPGRPPWITAATPGRHLRRVADVRSVPADTVLTCSARGCPTPARWERGWTNPLLPDPDRRKVWLACAEHRSSLGDFLEARGSSGRSNRWRIAYSRLVSAPQDSTVSETDVAEAAGPPRASPLLDAAPSNPGRTPSGGSPFRRT